MAEIALSEHIVDADPFKQFGVWFEESAGEPEHNAMVLATATQDGAPSARVVLLKAFDENGFVFYTNYESRKARELYENPRAAVVFHWPSLGRQLRIEGTLRKVSREESEHYFHSRPRESQLGAWASAQSSEIPSRRALEESVEAVRMRYEGKEIPLPPHWGGFCLSPISFEFWHKGTLGRIHDRIVYRKNETGSWYIVRLSA